MRWLAAMLLVLAAGCYHPNAATGQPCGPGDVCPDGQVCDTGQSPPICVTAIGSGTDTDASTAVDASPDDASVMPDADVDAAMGTCFPACTGATPVCDATTSACRGCVKDQECASNACDELTGTCVGEDLVLYVAVMGSGTLCTRTAPCGLISTAVAQVTAQRSFIKVGGGIYDDAWLTQSGMSVPFVVSGPNTSPDAVIVAFAQLQAGEDHVAELRNNGSMTLEGVTLRGAPKECLRVQNATLVLSHVALRTCVGGADLQSSTVTILTSKIQSNTAIGVALSGGNVTVDRTLISLNDGAGVFVQGGKFTITNSFIVSNPGGAGLQMQGGFDAGSRLDFSTIAQNGGTAGIVNSSGVSLVLSNTIIALNTVQTSGPLTATYTLDSDTALVGTGNIAGTASFVSPTDFHIQMTSPARNAADPLATLAIDFDGDPRPLPIGGDRDMGADEIP